jgi:hypothetical protein
LQVRELLLGANAIGDGAMARLASAVLSNEVRL